MDKGQREWTLEESGAGEVMNIEVQVALDGLLMIGGTRLDRRVRDPVSKAQREAGQIVGRKEIRHMEQTSPDRILMSTDPYLFNYGDGEDEIEDDEEADEVDSMADEFELLEIEDAEE
ncbi:hypothetical protein GCK72_011481 [Caenorhabditis remanei]|uniref:Uncharacterized protein n=1 Tax=Caenorhabditis remanei TaxID=31234 RepID=A0A6A5H7X5_CAERE|nr:hypothetical protein GCK72_011481 [Caenorhabditis remanei]KAF1763215.1 hypothetical protein GCK72_011481 [Caenorhabditis remanei]